MKITRSDMDLDLDQRLTWIIKVLFNIWVHSSCYETKIFPYKNIEDQIQFEIKDNSKSKVEKLEDRLEFWSFETMPFLTFNI